MRTKHFGTTINDIRQAAELLSCGGLIAFPTETVYGLGADALDPDAVAAVYDAKGRPNDNPMIVHIADPKDLAKLTDDVTDEMKALMDAFWPGPLTMVVPKRPVVPYRTTGGLETVAVRMPDCEPALELIRTAGTPVAAPSANLSGKPSPTRAEDVIRDMDGRIHGIICGEDCRIGIESTVLDMTGKAPVILRPGMITAEQIEEVLGRPVVYDESLYSQEPDEDMKPRSPGMKYKHYAPEAEMIVLSGNREKVEAEIDRIRTQKEAQGLKVGVILFEEDDFEEAAHDLFARLRILDQEGVDLIIAGAMSTQDQRGFAVMNRMLRSAGFNIREV